MPSLILTGCSSKDKLEVPKNAKLGPTTPGLTIEVMMKDHKM